MNHFHKNESVPPWQEIAEPKTFASLTSDLKVDVCIVGGGFGGLTSAYLLVKEGLSVAVLEDAGIASGQSGRSTAQLTYALDHKYYDLEKLHGREGIQLAAESHRAAISKVREIINEEEIDCESSSLSGFLVTPRNYKTQSLQDEFDILQKIGMTDIVLHSQAPFQFLNDCSAVEFPNQFKLNPRQYLQSLAKIIVARGGKIFTGTRAVKFFGGKNAYVKTADGFKVSCSSILVATHTPVNDILSIHTKQAAYRTYVMGFKIAKGSLPNILCWDTMDPYHYVRLAQLDSSEFEALIVGGEDHKTGQENFPEERYRSLEKWTYDRFQMAGEVLWRWSGQIMEPHDGLAFLGRNPSDNNNVYVITGDSGNGTTSATIGAMIITDQIRNRKNNWADLYSPSRISIRSGSEFIKENANTAAQYADWVRPTNMNALAHLKFKEGIVYRKGLSPVAVFKDASGGIVELSPICPHLGGIVRWNSSEKSWDCPCHGSRFDCYGKLIEGPAIKDLEVFTSNQGSSGWVPAFDSPDLSI